MKPRIILIREGLGVRSCCGGEGAKEAIHEIAVGGSEEVCDSHPKTSKIGDLYMALRKEYGERIDLDVVDASNQLFLIPSLISDCRKFSVSLKQAVKTVLFGVAPSSVIINGRPAHQGTLPSPDSLVQEIKPLVFRSDAVLTAR